jgi:hypothetical protein
VSIASIFGTDPDSAFAMALLVHAMILTVTSVGGVIAAVRLGVGLDTGGDALDEEVTGDASVPVPEPGPRPG